MNYIQILVFNNTPEITIFSVILVLIFSVIFWTISYYILKNYLIISTIESNKIEKYIPSFKAVKALDFKDKNGYIE